MDDSHGLTGSPFLHQPLQGEEMRFGEAAQMAGLEPGLVDEPAGFDEAAGAGLAGVELDPGLVARKARTAARGGPAARRGC